MNTGGYYTLDPYTMFVAPLFRYVAMSLTSGIFSYILGLFVLQKRLTNDYRRMFLQDDFVLCV